MPLPRDTTIQSEPGPSGRICSQIHNSDPGFGIQWAHTWVSAGCNIRLSSMCGFAFLPAPLGMVRSIVSGACNLVEISSLCRFFPFTCLVCVRPPRNVSTVFSPGHYVYLYLQKAPPLVNSLSSL